ncbi:hypothetical protein PR048_027302 [Dryococelus australis]|uniref:Uncharacterized protein n=1 Tax=Dryococelus australis TaxID=614101 RepID=A0ABQ9GF29_9NEOP|nr:hypothetical protein PR048_027302 [Dryococelus australis]
MIKRRTVNKIFDRLHKSVVVCCMAVTVIGTGMLGMRAYRYFAVVRPQQRLQEDQQRKELLKEGKALSDSTLEFRDPAPQLKL